MMLRVLAIALTIVCLTPLASAADSRIEHIVVLMLENRAFDHMLGYLKQVNPEIDGLNGTEFNPVNASDPNSGVIVVNDHAAYVDPDPGHGVGDTTQQIWGTRERSDPPPMNGFVENAFHHFSNAGVVMSCFDQQSVPVISNLALEYALFDRWYASVPGPTMPNRAYAGSATSHGASTNDVLDILLGYPQRTIFASLNDTGRSWHIYFEEIPSMLQFADIRHLDYLGNYFGMSEFAKHCADNTLPDYSFLEPGYFDGLPFFPPANDQHPSHDVSLGEQLMKTVYEGLLNSPAWNTTLLLITYDEHGGFFDHRPTPLHGVPNPDGINSTYPFDFDRLGIRVPAIAISPYIAKGTVIHEPAVAHFEHSSIPATVKKFFDLPNFLTKRDEWAATFEQVLTLSTPRTDCPTTLPSPQPLLHSWKPATGENPITDFQRELIAIAAGINGESMPDEHELQSFTERDAARWVREKATQFFGREIPASPIPSYLLP